MKLYSYHRSSCSYRLRIALNLKAVEYQYIAVNLLKQEQQASAYKALNPLGLVPAVEIAEGEILGQSVALLEWLEETRPQPPLLPAEPLQRARVRAMVNTIACDIQPLCNMGVTSYLKEQHTASQDSIQQWYAFWMHRGFEAIESTIANNRTAFCFSRLPGMADVFLVPQVYNARRMGVDMTAFPTIARITDHCNDLPAFIAAAPENQPDSP